MEQFLKHVILLTFVFVAVVDFTIVLAAPDVETGRVWLDKTNETIGASLIILGIAIIVYAIIKNKPQLKED